jgi:membrane-associated phospholipid phosphatase
MKGYVRIVAAALFVSLFCFAGVAEVRGATTTSSQTPGDVLKNIGDAMVYVVPAAAFGMTLGAKDGAGAWQFTESGVISMGIVASFKYTVKSRRPNGDPQSFPSGHTAIMVQSAEFMRERYGWRYGLPAYVLSAFVGYSRVVSGQHFARDVYAGAAMGFIGAFLVTKPYKGNTVQLAVDGKGTPKLIFTRRF